MPPPALFQREDTYSRKRWRRVQYLADEFGKRWRSEFLLDMQRQTKWIKPRRHLQHGDFVIIKDDAARRNQWQLARVDEPYMDADGLVCKVKLKLATSNLDKEGNRKDMVHTYIECPIHKLVLILCSNK